MNFISVSARNNIHAFTLRTFFLLRHVLLFAGHTCESTWHKIIFIGIIQVFGALRLISAGHKVFLYIVLRDILELILTIVKLKPMFKWHS